MPWTEIDGAPIHYTPAEGSTATEAEVQEEIRRSLHAAAVAQIARLKQMPTEAEALQVLGQAYQRLRELGWNDAIYCPKDGSSFDVIEAGSTGIHRCHYDGEWPKGSWWIEADGDLWPSRPILYRPPPGEIAKWREVREAFDRKRAAPAMGVAPDAGKHIVDGSADPLPSPAIGNSEGGASQ